jgi:hypothetical protein
MSKVKSENLPAKVEDNMLAQLKADPAAVDEGLITPSAGAFYPFLEMVFPIMINPEKPHYKGHEYDLGFVSGGKFEALPAGTILTMFDSRNAIKRVYQDDNGQDTNEYCAAKITRNGVEFANSAERFEALKEEAQDRSNRSVNLGTSSVVVALYPDGKTVVLNFSAFKTVNGYLFNYLQPAKLQNGVGLQINLDNHECNLTKSKTTGYYYPDGKKFKQWEHVTLEKEQQKAALAALQKTAEEYDNWLKA